MLQAPFGSPSPWQFLTGWRSHLRPTPPCPHSWSVAVVPNSVDQTTATIAITPPAFGTFDIFVLSVCVKPSSGTPSWDACPKTNCLPTQVRSRRAGCCCCLAASAALRQAGAATAGHASMRGTHCAGSVHARQAGLMRASSEQ